NRFFLPIRDLGAKYTVMQAAMASAERIFGLLDRAPTIVSVVAGAASPDRTAGGPNEGAVGSFVAGSARPDPTAGGPNGRGVGSFVAGAASPDRVEGGLNEMAVAPSARSSRSDKPSIEFASVSFSYTGELDVLRDCSFRVAAGEHVALVGATGEG